MILENMIMFVLTLDKLFGQSRQTKEYSECRLESKMLAYFVAILDPQNKLCFARI